MTGQDGKETVGLRERANMAGSCYEAVVIGAGIHGLSTLYHLQRMGCRRVALVEHFGLGHKRGSSHGASRITRSAYHHAGYVRLMQRCREESWPQLEADAQTQLIFPTPCCFFGPKHGAFAKYAEAVLAGGSDVRELDRQAARQRFPLFRFSEEDGILDDRTAGIIAAADTLQALVRLTSQAGATLLEHTAVHGFASRGERICLDTSRGPLETERLVVTGGAWSANLLPFLSTHLSVTRQTVMYFDLVEHSWTAASGTFPVWAYLMDELNGLHYGIPAFGGYSAKVARHITYGRSDDPEQEGVVEEEMLTYLRGFLQKLFVPTVARMTHAETCLYTNTPTEDFVIDVHPESSQIAVGTGFSGHGFKFGPLTGRILAELVMDGKSTVPEFEEIRGMFAIPTLSGVAGEKI